MTAVAVAGSSHLATGISQFPSLEHLATGISQFPSLESLGTNFDSSMHVSVRLDVNCFLFCLEACLASFNHFFAQNIAYCTWKQVGNQISIGGPDKKKFWPIGGNTNSTE